MRILLLVILLALTACGSPPKVPVSSRDTISVREQTEKIGGDYVTYVRTGDTLYSIAFGAGLSPADVAAWNGMAQDDVLYAGQKVRLTRPLNFREKPQERIVVAVDDKPRQQATRQKENAKSAPVVKRPQRQKKTSSKPKRVATRLNWLWPTVGRVSSSFSVARGNKGVDINGKRGQDVVASAGGKVVYAGNGLRGYGNLLIIKHNDQFLSAYAHNDNILVKEGQFVQQGQRISVMGVAKSGKPVLHFEIRLQGQPVDPVKYLPKQ